MPGSGRCPAEGTGNPLQCSGLESPKDREAWWATVHGVTESWTRLSDLTFILKIANLDDDVEHGDSPTLLAGI